MKILMYLGIVALGLLFTILVVTIWNLYDTDPTLDPDYRHDI